MQSIWVSVFDGSQSFVQPGADRSFQVGDACVAAFLVVGTPACIERHKEIILVGIVELLFDQFRFKFLAFILGGELSPVGGELITQSLEE